MDDTAAQALESCREKRNFNITPEPAEGGAHNNDERSFIVQKHWVSRLHRDLRLELGGAMKPLGFEREARPQR